MLDTETTRSMGIVGTIPLAIGLLFNGGELLAQASTNGMSPTLFNWANLTATGLIFVAFIWLLAWHIPAREERYEKRQEEREKATELRLRTIHEDFLESLRERDETLREHSKEMQAAINSLVAENRRLSDAHTATTFALKQVVQSQADLCRRLELMQNR